MNLNSKTKKHINKRISYWLSAWGLSIDKLSLLSWRKVYRLLKKISKTDINFLMKRKDLKVLAKTLVSFDIENISQPESKEVMENFLEISLNEVINKREEEKFFFAKEIKLFDLLFINKHPLTLE